MTDHTTDAPASALADTGYVFDHIDAYEEPVGKCILLADLPKALAAAGYVLVHTAPDEATVERLAEVMQDALDEREEMHERMCPSGCGCRYMTEDPDRRDCACDGRCCMDPDWWDRRNDHEVAARALLAALGAAAPAERDGEVDE